MKVTGNSLFPTEEFKESFVQSIYNGNTYDYKDFIKSKNTRAKNGNPYNRLDFIYENLMNTFLDDNFETRLSTSGNWQKHLQIIDKKRKTLYIVGKDDRIQLIRMQRSLERSPHYFESYCLINERMGDIKYVQKQEQISFDFSHVGIENPLVGEFYNQKKSNLDKLMGGIEVDTFILIAISIKKDEIIEVAAHIPRPEFQDSYYLSEDWSQYIPVQFAEQSDYDIAEDIIDEDIPLGLKKEILEDDSLDTDSEPKLKGNQDKQKGQDE
ncbi:TPA: DUF5986 family protein [Bacillus cereus]|nr:hypothetical protein [Bacillus cereus]